MKKAILFLMCCFVVMLLYQLGIATTGDYDNEGDVDGADLSILSINPSDVDVFAANFGNTFLLKTLVAPNETFTNTPTTLTVTADVGGLEVSAINAYQISETGQTIALLGQMYDDGTHGDEIAADNIFTTRYILNRPAESKFYVRVIAVDTSGKENFGPSTRINVFEPVPEETVDGSFSVSQELRENYDTYRQLYDGQTARQMVLLDAKNNPNITEAGLYGYNLFFVYDGIIYGAVFLPEDTATNSHVPAASQKQPESQAFASNVKTPGNNKVQIFASFYAEDHMNHIPDDALQRFSLASWMDFSVSPILKNENASIDKVLDWVDYGTIIVNSHGGYSPYGPFFTVGEEFIRPLTYDRDLDVNAHRLGYALDNQKIRRYIVFPSFFLKYFDTKKMPDAFIYMGFCKVYGSDKDSSAFDYNLVNALLFSGAKIVYGFYNSVHWSFNYEKFIQLIEPMVPIDSEVKPKFARDAYDDISPKVDPIPDDTGTHARFKMSAKTSDWENFVFCDEDEDADGIPDCAECYDFPPPAGKSLTYRIVGTPFTFTTTTEEVSEKVGGYDVYRLRRSDNPPGLGEYIGCDPTCGLTECEVEVATDWWDISDPTNHGRIFWEPPLFYCQYGEETGSECEWSGTFDGTPSRVVTELITYEDVTVPYGTFVNTMKVRVTEYDESDIISDGPTLYWGDSEVGIIRGEEEDTGAVIELIGYNPPEESTVGVSNRPSLNAQFSILQKAFREYIKKSLKSMNSFESQKESGTELSD